MKWDRADRLVESKRKLFRIRRNFSGQLKGILLGTETLNTCDTTRTTATIVVIRDRVIGGSNTLYLLQRTLAILSFISSEHVMHIHLSMCILVFSSQLRDMQPSCWIMSSMCFFWPLNIWIHCKLTTIKPVYFLIPNYSQYLLSIPVQENSPANVHRPCISRDFVRHLRSNWGKGCLASMRGIYSWSRLTSTCGWIVWIIEELSSEGHKYLIW